MTATESGAERSHLYRLLADVFRAEPGPELLAVVRTPAFTELAAALGITVDVPGLEDLDDLAVEYTRLFLGPGPHISLYESAQRCGGSLWGPETAEVRGLLSEAGFDLDPSFRDLPDHIAVELEFLAHLTSCEAVAARRGDTALEGRARAWQEMFLSRHLGAWVDGFCARVQAEARMPFYAAFAAILRAFIASEGDSARCGY